MNSQERWEKIKVVFEASLSRTGGERRAFLESACGDDREMYAEVESLLASFDADYLEGAAVDEVADAFVSRNVIDLKPGAVFGQYRIVSELGKGGQGSVYKAHDEKLDRIVAIKTLPPELTIDDTARKRFTREARLASSLDHPNICTIHDLVESSGSHAIVMQFVDGKNVRDLLNGKPLELTSALRVCIQVCDALAAAHSQGIIHRDIKAHNVIVTENGTAKVLDFGLAKIIRDGEADRTELTALGSPYGTPTYAAPEQSRGEKVDHRADIFSTGVLLYELLTGTWAFHGKTAIDVRYAVLHDQPKPVAERRGEAIPEPLNAIVKKALDKEPSKRFRSAAEMRDQLIDVLKGLTQGESSTGSEFIARYDGVRPQHFVSGSAVRRRYILAAATAFILIAAAGGYFYRSAQNAGWAADQLSRVSSLTKERRYFEAYDLAQTLSNYLPESALSRFTPMIADELTVSSNEDGADVYLKRYSPDGSKTQKRELVGKTPIKKLRIARGDYVIEIEKDGFAPIRRSFSSNPDIYWDLSFNPPPTSIDVRLFANAEIPEGMVFVPGGEYGLVSWKKPTTESIPLSDFFIDRYEVSNKEYREFVAAGGYLKKEFWKTPIINDGKTLDWDAAMLQFKDKTGLPGPRTWSNQTFPDGRAEHPVTDITWYEAAAYAEFRGKSLANILQWEKAARDGAITQSTGEVLPWGFFQPGDALDGRANFASRDAVPVDSNEFGMSPFGCYNMAGNVAEWCVNQTDEGFAAAGGSWGDPSYNFGSIASFPGGFASSRLGFRCVKNTAPAGRDAARFDESKAVPLYKKTSQSEFEGYRSFYRYDKTPTGGKIIDAIETADWRREKIEFAGANDEKAIAYLYLPKNAKPPYQTIQYVPAGDVYGGFATLPVHVETFASSQIRAGRAVFAVVLRGFLERELPSDHKPAPPKSVRYRDRLANDTRDLQRGLDYLETRDDIDKTKLAYWGYSAGAEFGILYLSLESRFKTAVLMAVGLSRGNNEHVPEANIANFAPHILMPKLLINGRYDEQYSWRVETEPLIKLLAEPKQLIQYDAGHTPPPEIAVPAITKWLDEKLGPVAR
ncbi:MAG: protein kinase [Pyrinomonadaceae bacterium]